MRVLVACEFSGIVRESFRRQSHDAWSCDLLDTEIQGQHIKGDVRNILNDEWDLMIAHPPCTYLCAGGNNWLNRKPEWRKKRVEALDFVRCLLNSGIPRIALENPIGAINTQIRKPDQVLRAFMFGHPYTKDICLWLKNLPHLKPTKILPPPYKTFDFWSTDRLLWNGQSKKSVTFQGVAEAMAAQWGILQSVEGEEEQ